jgi:SAM-dependent methyltransferase
VRRYGDRIRAGGAVLDVACGGGRHGRYLAQLGYSITSVDLDVAKLRARESLDPSPTPIEIVEADLEGSAWPFADRMFDGIVVVNYLHRPHIPLLIDALAPGGALLFDTFAVGNERYGRPRNPAYLLAPGELLRAFGAALDVVAYADGLVAEPGPAIRQSIFAVRR